MFKSLSNFGEASYNPVIEAWRFLAACIVVVCHYRGIWSTQAGYWDLTATGVDLFFVLSGFVFAPTLLRGMTSYRAFMIRRFFRMYPLYLLALVVYASLPGKGFSLEIFSAHLLMLQTTVSAQWVFAYNPAFWSLPPEWAFYCAMPLLVFLIRWQGLLVLLASAAIFRVIFGWWVEPIVATTTSLTLANWAVVNLPGILIEFLLGVWVYRLQAHPRLRAHQGQIAIGFFALLALVIWLYGQLIVGAQPHPFIGNLVGVCAALVYALALWLTLAWGTAWSQALQTKIFYLGALSYGIYLFHNAAPAWITIFLPNASPWILTIASVLGTLGFAHLAHFGLEAPLRRYGRQLSGRFLPSQNS